MFKKILFVFAVSCSLLSSITFAADHGDAPTVRLDTRLDINDLYVFQSPTNAANTVFILTTNPVAGITGALTYHPEGQYEILVDNDNDSKEEITYRLRFSRPNAANVQRIHLFKITKGENSKQIAHGDTLDTEISVQGGGKLRAGVFDDPFFFDILAFRNGLAFSSTNPVNFFKGLNTLAIVLEVPSSTITGKNGSSIGVYARTVKEGKQIDRTGRPAINTVLVKLANKDKFNRKKPIGDGVFKSDAISIIQSLGNSAANATAIADVLFPDLLTFDTASSAGFLNGRRLQDDVIDAALQLLTGNNAASDFVSNDSNFSNTFPYLATKNP